MLGVEPFRAFRYNPAVVSDLGRVIAPPYDMIGAAEQKRLYRASPYNVVRLILAREYPLDTVVRNRYTRARGKLNAWRARGGAAPGCAGRPLPGAADV